jgi:predicted ATPase/DNA-binding SARP family transcriptional activator
MPNALRIGLLGPLQVRDETGSLVHVGGRQLRVLLTLLALNAGRVVPAGSLAGELWPDDPPGNPGNALQTLISRLRAELRQAGAGHVIESHPAGYRLAVPPDAVDVTVFETLAARGRRALADGDAAQAARVLREALLAWRGQPLADVAGSEFADVAAARLTELRSSVLADRIEADLALGEGASLVGELRVLLSADPLAERPRALLMHALYAAGRQAEAIAAYREGRELLADQLGLDPSAQLEQAYLGILRGGEQPAAAGKAPARSREPSQDPERAAGPAPVQRPASRAQTPLTSFVGRDEDVSRVLKNLRAARLVTLTGPGGVGKTRLATEAAGQLDVAAWFVPLAPVADPAEVAYAVLGTLGVREPVIARRAAESGAGPLDRLAAALADRDEVLILDNCEHVIEAAAALAGHVLAHCPGVRILATSRQPLRIDGETLSPVSPLPIPPAPGAPVVVASYGSARLFRDRAVAVRPDFELGQANAADVARICRALDGMPLAIELAAVWLRTLTPAQLAERLDDRFALLTGGSRTALPRHRTLRAVVDWSWDLLSDPEQVLARRLAVFPGGATLAAAEQVCAGGQLPPAAVLPALSGLVDKSIVAAVEGPDNPGRAEGPEGAKGSGARYHMLETVRAYGLEQLTEAGELDRVRETFAARYLDLAETADSRLRGPGQRRWLPELAAEQDNLHTALRWTIARQDGDRALRFVLALGWYWSLRGQPGEPEELARQALALEPRERSTRMAEARIVCALTAAGPLFDLDAVRPALTAALADFAELSDGALMTHPLAAMGEPMLILFDRDPDRAMALFDRYAESDDPWTRAAAPLQRGAFDSVLGRLEQAEADCRSSLAAFRELGDPWATAASLVQLAQFARLRADYPTAITYLQEAVGLGRELGAWGDLVHIGGLVAAVRLRMGDLAAARADLEQAEREDSARGGFMSDSAVWFGLVEAEIHVAEGDSAAVVQQCERVLSWLDRRRSAWWQGFRAQVEARLALAVLSTGERARARALLADALRDAQDWVELPPLADVIDAIAVLALPCLPGGATPPDPPARPDSPGPECAATLLGAAHSIRGCFDESSLDAPAARDAARARLGADEFAVAYQRGRDLARDDALALAASAVARPVTGSAFSPNPPRFPPPSPP